ncbi:N-acetylmuramoyl-L-alanine amidase [Sulfurimonas sp. MAG313]|nr:peptidoglycan recognition family protein [Sulfurimonas sp. MAG313]MDF1881664.1 N-acetylmuramoyl-L-alanine amidase [Sulfurimonas sp. MAG313]
MTSAVKVYLLLTMCSLNSFAMDIVQKPIIFNQLRLQLSKEYISKHYEQDVDDITIIPRIIVIHWTAIDDLDASFKRFLFPTLPLDRPDIQKASSLNVSTHFMIDTDGTIYQLMPETTMARHVIGLNFSSIGIENVGGQGNKPNLSSAQLQSNKNLILYLTNKYSSINYLIGHSEYTQCENTSLWLEKDKNYRTIKYDPGDDFMKALRSNFNLKTCHD